MKTCHAHSLTGLLTVLAITLLGCSEPEQRSPDPTARASAPKPMQAIPISPIEAPAAAKVGEALDDASATGTLEPYDRILGIAGNLSSTGSDTLANLMTMWTEEFKRSYPSVNIQVQAAGSSTAPPALTEGTANFGPMSRAMKDKEIEAFEVRHGYKPTKIRVAIDALAVFVHKDNPLNALSISQVDSIFSVTRRCGGESSLDAWGSAGLLGSWINRPIQLYGRNSVSGTYGYFKKIALCSGDFKSSVNEQPGSASVVQAVASSLNGIGYSGIGYITSGVKPLALAAAGGGPVAATPANALTGAYPLSRYLYIYINKKPNTSLTPLDAEFVKLVLSKQGQEIVRKDGYIPVSAEVASAELQKL